MIRTLLVALFVTFTIGLYCSEEQQICEILETKAAHIQNVYEIQERLKEAGHYHGAIDGKWGLSTEGAYCDWNASKYFKKEIE